MSHELTTLLSFEQLGPELQLFLLVTLHHKLDLFLNKFCHLYMIYLVYFLPFCIRDTSFSLRSYSASPFWNRVYSKRKEFASLSHKCCLIYKRGQKIYQVYVQPFQPMSYQWLRHIFSSVTSFTDSCWTNLGFMKLRIFTKISVIWPVCLSKNWASKKQWIFRLLNHPCWYSVLVMI